MIYLTGDVHTKIKGNWEQKVPGSELDAAKKYLEILKKYKITCTLFINGICLKKDKEAVKGLLKFNVEFGGHTYDNFGGMNIIKSYLYRKIFGCIYGPAWYQEKDIKRTKKAFERLGLEMKSWRTHAFGSNDKTFKILKKHGVRSVSDFVGKTKPFYKEVMHLPINIPVDNNIIAYGPLTPENRDPFASCTKSRINSEEWFEILKKRVKENEKQGKESVLLIHPETMDALDNFVLFEKVVRFLSRYKSAKISEFRL